MRSSTLTLAFALLWGCSSSNQVPPCGAQGEACCNQTACDSGLVCLSEVCTRNGMTNSGATSTGTSHGSATSSSTGQPATSSGSSTGTTGSGATTSTSGTTGTVVCGGVSQGCCANGQCNGSLVCQGGACVQSASGPTGTPCSKNSDCPTGICLPVGQPPGGQPLGEPAWTGNVCSTPCGSAADCTAGWSCEALLGQTGNVCQCVYGPESCNAKDDDCNGVVDDEPAVDAACERGNPLDSCQAGTCSCAQSNLCSGQCRNLATDPSNCGACGHACASGATCTGGTCDCPNSETACAGTCTNLSTDDANCGSCGHACVDGQLCTGAKCSLPMGSICNDGGVPCALGFVCTPVSLASWAGGVCATPGGTPSCSDATLCTGEVTTAQLSSEGDGGCDPFSFGNALQVDAGLCLSWGYGCTQSAQCCGLQGDTCASEADCCNAEFTTNLICGASHQCCLYDGVPCDPDAGGVQCCSGTCDPSGVCDLSGGAACGMSATNQTLPCGDNIDCTCVADLSGTSCTCSNYAGSSCTSRSQCLSNDCRSGKCVVPSGGCQTDADCADDLEFPNVCDLGVCCGPAQNPCSGPSDCCSNYCQPIGTCG